MSETKNWTNTRSMWPSPWPDHTPVEGREDVAGVELRWYACGNLNVRTSVIQSEREDGTRVYQDVHAACSPTPTDDWDKAEPFVDGWVKFDGCYHLEFGDERGYMHLCGNEGLDQLLAVLARIRELANEHTEINW